jgi:UDP-N-acetylglucosamine 3-dehydrogenase
MLVEKPMSSTVVDAEAIIDAARQAGVWLMPGHILRFENRYATIHEKLSAGELGRVVSIQARRNRTKLTRQKYMRAHPVFAVAVHDIDLLLWYTGARAKRVRAWQRNVSGGLTPDVFWGMVEFDNGVLAFVESTWLTPDRTGIPSDDILHLITDRGVASLDFARDGLSIWGEDSFSIPDVTVAPRIRGYVGGALAAELSYFAACVQTGQEPTVVQGKDALEGIRIAAAFVESAEEEREIELS